MKRKGLNYDALPLEQLLWILFYFICLINSIYLIFICFDLFILFDYFIISSFELLLIFLIFYPIRI